MKKRSPIYNLSIRRKLALLSTAIILPLMIVTVVVTFNLNRIAASYDMIVKNITNANAYNTIFKEEMDSVMYQMVARSLSKEEVEEELSMPNPDTLIDEAEEAFTDMKEHTETDEARGRIDSILKLLNTLRRRADEINDTVKITGHYEENMVRLDTDIRIITELIQERISEYIYYESSSMEATRLKIEHQRTVVFRVVVIAIILIAALSIYLSIVISRGITVPIDELCRVTDEVANGNFDVRAEFESGDELMQLEYSLNSMTSQLNDLVENIRKEQINSRNLELRLLQSQINPHFLYNTLDNILWLSEDGKKEEVASIVTSLSKFFRTTLSGGREFVRIRDEISHIESYLEIQQFRYRDIMDYEIDAPEKYLGFSIIKMTLQPIVENALYHGLKNKRGKGLLKIGIYGREDLEQLVLTVEDNGIGMKEEELLHIRRIADGLEKPSIDNSGFGIANVAERLRLNYGNACGLHYESEYGVGTKAEIIIPMILYGTV